MAIVIGLVPALCWGFLPLLAQKLGGKPINQLLGTTVGAFLLGAAVFLWRRPAVDATVFWFCFFSGMCWAMGQMLQYVAYTEVGVSRALPVSSGMQLFGNSLMGVLALGEWPATRQKLLGFGSVAIIVVGAAITTWQQDKSRGGGNMRKALAVLAASTLGYVGYSALPRFVSADGGAEFFPQTTGMLAMGVALALFMTRGRAFAEKTSRTNVATGLVFAVGALAYLVSTTLNGVAVGFALSQMNVVISTWGSIFLLGEKKTKKERLAVFIGLALVILGGAGVSFA